MKRNDSASTRQSACFLDAFWHSPLGTKPTTDIGLGLQPTSELLDVVVIDTVTVGSPRFVKTASEPIVSAPALWAAFLALGKSASLATQPFCPQLELWGEPRGRQPLPAIAVHGRHTATFAILFLRSALGRQPVLRQCVLLWTPQTTGDEWVSPLAGAMDLRPADGSSLEGHLAPHASHSLRTDLGQTLVVDWHLR